MFSLDRNLYYRCGHCGEEGVKSLSEIEINETHSIGTIHSESFHCSNCSNILGFGYSLMAQEDRCGFFSIIYSIRPIFMDLLDEVQIIHDPLYVSQIDGLSPLQYARTLDAIEDLRRDITRLVNIDRREFEQVIAELIRDQGFKVELTAQTRDGGRDIIGITQVGDIPFKLFVECKRKNAGNPVDVEIVRSVYGVHNSQDGPNKSIIVSTTNFTKDARRFADQETSSKWELDLYDFHDIERWIKQYRRKLY